jgi:hypothetical protein
MKQKLYADSPSAYDKNYTRLAQKTGAAPAGGAVDINRVFMRGILVCAAGVGLCLSPAYASSNNDRGGNGNGGANDAELALSVEGRISALLSDASGRKSVGFEVYCNQTLSVIMTSANGGLEHPTRKRQENFPGFGNFVPYTARFSVNANEAQPVAVSSQAMLGGAGGSIGTTPYRATGALEFSWTTEQPLLGGTYTDIIEIRVTGAGEDEIPRL